MTFFIFIWHFRRDLKPRPTAYYELILGRELIDDEKNALSIVKDIYA